MKTTLYTLVVPRFEDIFHSFYAQEIIKGASSAASRLKLDMLIHICERCVHEEWDRSPLFTSGISRGILFADIDQDREGLKKVISRNIPYVVLNNYFLEPVNCIGIDNYKATRQIMDYLVSLGHTNIATICGDLNTEAGQERLKGYTDGLKVHGLPINKQYIKKGGFLRTPARRAAELLLSLENRPTAVFAASDVMALEVLDVARQKNIPVPQHLSVIGFDDNPLNNYSSIGLTTVRQPIEEMARIGLETLHRIVQREESVPVQKKLSARLIKRESCAPCAAVKQ
ncbi:MAG: substrate-binding domain-containing protein [Candidatus Omnitrophica bacterium]|nr:substrate-binding domain-containing protein [Candidatus Omnitrophota bacterium]